MASLVLLLQILIYFIIACEMRRPNVLLVLTDDQDITLGGLVPMKIVQNLIANKGVTFINAFSTTPICCPSRSSILTGKYVHNHYTVNNSISGGCSNIKWQQSEEKKSIAVSLHNAGYKTLYAGKYLNQYGKKASGGPQHVPMGWDWWLGLVGNSRYYNYSLSINGSRKHFTSDYLTDVIKENALEFLRHISDHDSFLMVLSPPAPHAPFTPAPTYKDKFKNVSALRTPNFNLPVKKDKHWLVRMKPNPLPSHLLPTLDDIYRRRWETLLSVDDMVESLIRQLEINDMLKDTFIIYTSDHGYHIGQFGLPWDKRQPYEFDIRIPLLVRGPGVPHKEIAMQPVLNIDLAPTILSMAQLPDDHDVDGKSFLHVLRRPGRNKGRVFLIEYQGEGESSTVARDCALPFDDTLSECAMESCCKCQDSRNNTYTCIRQLQGESDFLFCEFLDDENFIEVYDLKKDPYQIHNLASVLEKEMVSFFRSTLRKYRKCKGRECP